MSIGRKRLDFEKHQRNLLVFNNEMELFFVSRLMFISTTSPIVLCMYKFVYKSFLQHCFLVAKYIDLF